MMFWIGVWVSRFDKLRSCCRPAGSKRMSTGHSHLMVRISPQTEKTGNYVSSFPFFGPSVEIRTRGLLNPIQARYQTSPHPDASVDCQNILAHCFGKSKYFFWYFEKIWQTRKVRLFLTGFFNPRVIKYTADNQSTAENLQHTWNFTKEENGKDGGNNRFTQLRCRNEGRGEVFQAPAENAVPQNGWKDSKEKTYQHGPKSMA